MQLWAALQTFGILTKISYQDNFYQKSGLQNLSYKKENVIIYLLLLGFRI